jgi:hypothetical protein
MAAADASSIWLSFDLQMLNPRCASSLTGKAGSTRWGAGSRLRFPDSAPCKNTQRQSLIVDMSALQLAGCSGDSAI